jgi:uncharacterized coiled-coil protein SlyX
MARSIGILPGVAAFLAGVAAAVLVEGSRHKRGSGQAASSELKSELAELEARMVVQETANTARFAQIESRLEDHSVRLADTPSTSQIVSAMEEILARTMSSLDKRLTSQASSIETLKTTVTQTDSLLERVLESLDSMQSLGADELAEEALSKSH